MWKLVRHRPGPSRPFRILKDGSRPFGLAPPAEYTFQSDNMAKEVFHFVSLWIERIRCRKVLSEDVAKYVDLYYNEQSATLGTPNANYRASLYCRAPSLQYMVDSFAELVEYFHDDLDQARNHFDQFGVWVRMSGNAERVQRVLDMAWDHPSQCQGNAAFRYKACTRIFKTLLNINFMPEIPIPPEVAYDVESSPSSEGTCRGPRPNIALESNMDKSERHVARLQHTQRADDILDAASPRPSASQGRGLEQEQQGQMQIWGCRVLCTIPQIWEHQTSLANRAERQSPGFGSVRHLWPTGPSTPANKGTETVLVEKVVDTERPAGSW